MENQTCPKCGGNFKFIEETVATEDYYICDCGIIKDSRDYWFEIFKKEQHKHSCKFYNFTSNVSCLLVEGVEFMDHEEIYEAIKKEHDVLQCKEI